ncbi:SusF/SusE family outer membrane protein [Marinoscillum sp. 108]|uniref:SusF/SusE family outer membrane protein n=1 Tax=Marinoscillum luteum TaxID=861051 RepID=A0ABW7N665_9BACT|nr:SusF/SusE family outer membrane protein [Marinoscillum sp. 108]VXD21051.1 conserved hypothetical protein [Marinoscillum sp. 108]
MKKVLSNLIAPVVIMAALFSCEDEISNSFDVLDIAPVIDEVTPNGSVKIGSEFDIVIKAHDGESSPLASVSAKLKDADGNELATKSGTMSGTSGTFTWAAADFGSTALDTGDYTISVTVTDVANLSVSGDYSFIVFDLPFDATYPEMYIAGNFNSWGADALELVAANTWQITSTLDGGGWKFKNTPDWSDIDWGDSDCDGVMEVATGGGPDTNCGHTGESIITFNDKTLAYTVELVEPIAQNITGLYLVGSFNNFEGSDEYKFKLDSDNTWILAEVILKEGDVLKFAEAADLSKKNWGDNEPDGEADLFGSSIVLDNSYSQAYYKVTFNDATLAYQFDFVKFPSISIIGSATTGDDSGWGIDVKLRDFGNNSFRHAMGIYEGAFKFRQNESWDNQWGGFTFPSGTATKGGGDVSVSLAQEDTYIIMFNPSSGEVSFTATEIALIGSATGDDTWSTDINMTRDLLDPAVWTLNVDLVVGEAKIRTDETWDYNWGPDGYDTPANFNITEAGNYDVTININTGVASFEKN